MITSTYASPLSSNPTPIYAFFPPSPSTRSTKYLDESRTGSTELFEGEYNVEAKSSPVPWRTHKLRVQTAPGSIKGGLPVLPSSSRISHVLPFSKTLIRPCQSRPCSEFHSAAL